MADHDQRMKHLLRGFVPELLALLVPAWVPRYDLPSLAWQEQEVFLDPPEGERRLLDMVAHVRLIQPIGEYQESLLHIEGESGDGVGGLRRRMPLYKGALQARHGLPVLSLAVYLNVGLEGIGWDESPEMYWEARIGGPRWPYLGLPALDAWAFVQRENILGAALSVKMRIADNEKARLKATAMRRIATAAVDTARRFSLMDFVEAYLPLEEPHLSEFNDLLLTKDYKEAAMLGKTTLEVGREQGQQSLARRMVEARFGTLDAEALRRLEAMDEDDLVELGLALQTAKTLADLGLAGSP